MCNHVIEYMDLGHFSEKLTLLLLNISLVRRIVLMMCMCDFGGAPHVRAHGGKGGQGCLVQGEGHAVPLSMSVLLAFLHLFLSRFIVSFHVLSH